MDRGQGKLYERQPVRVRDIYLCLLYYYFVTVINLETKFTLIFILFKLKRNCKQLAYI